MTDKPDRGNNTVSLDAWMMVPGWVSLQQMIDNIDHICQLAGNTNHVGFGTEQGPMDLDTIDDLQKIPEMLQQRGYSKIDHIMHGNFLRFLEHARG